MAWVLVQVRLLNIVSFSVILRFIFRRSNWRRARSCDLLNLNLFLGFFGLVVISIIWRFTTEYCSHFVLMVYFVVDINFLDKRALKELNILSRINWKRSICEISRQFTFRRVLLQISDWGGIFHFGCTTHTDYNSEKESISLRHKHHISAQGPGALFCLKMRFPLIHWLAIRSKYLLKLSIVRLPISIAATHPAIAGERCCRSFLSVRVLTEWLWQVSGVYTYLAVQ